ncbi:phage protein [Bacillus luti]|uniref:phage protein n=1 Tax=Bacillus luti TaxID=2026191 RepID=UPI003D65497F
MSSLWGRKYEAVMGHTVFKNEAFTINFDVPFDDGSDPNISEIEVYNLSDSTINQVEEGAVVYVNAGYQSDVGTILTGTLCNVSTDWSGTDKITTFYVRDANDNWMEKWVEKTYAENITGKQVLSDLISMSGLQIGSFDLPVNTVYKSAKTVKTMLGQAIIEVARDCSAKVHVNKGSIFIRDRIRDKNRGNEVGFILDKDHGLIGTPSPIITSYDVGIDENRRTINRAGFKVLSLLHHRVTTDSVIQIKSKTANGLFRVEKGKHKANGNTYYTEMEVYSLL